MSELTPVVPLRVLARSLAIAVVLAVSCLKALPGRPLHAESLQSVGLAEGPLRDAVLTVSRAGVEARRLLLVPFDPLYDRLGMGQSWGLFTSKGRTAWRVRIEAMRKDLRWEVLYRAHEVDVLGLAPQLTSRRLRGIYNPRNKQDSKPQYDAFVGWVAHRVLSQHPQYLGVRVSMERLRLGRPGEQTVVAGVEHRNEVFREGTP